MKKVISFLIVCILGINLINAESITVSSEDKDVKLQVSLTDEELSFVVLKNGKQLISSTSVGLTINGLDFNKFKIINKKKTHFSELWKPVWGKQSEISNQYNELTLLLKVPDELGGKLNIVFRVYKDGVAFRYEIPNQKEINKFELNRDLTCFEVHSDAMFWTPNEENHNIGPVNISSAQDYLQNKKGYQTPMVIELPNVGYIGVHEAATYDFAYSLLKPMGNNKFQFDMEPSVGSTPAKTSWRVFMTGDKPGDLFESNILYNLNPPCAIVDPSWIKPGITFEDWRGLGTKEGEFTYGADEESYRRYIDFAAEQNIDYFIPSGWWYQTEGIRFWGNNQDMKAVVEYANRKGVGIIMYIDRIREKGTGWNLEDVLEEWHSWGVRGIKYGFLRGECRQGNQELVQKTRAIVELCAKYQMVVDFHDGPVPPSGDSRTWPNLIAREYCHAQCDAKRSYEPKTFVTSALVNGISGSLDMGTGYFDLNTLEKRDKIWEPVPSTVVGEVARNIILGSGVLVLPDTPDAYRRKLDLFQIIPMLKGNWDETRVLDSKIGEYIVVARRKGSQWIIGAATNEESRELTIQLGFLGEGDYQALVFEDGETVSAFGNKEDYEESKASVSKSEPMIVKMAPGGGFCMVVNMQSYSRAGIDSSSKEVPSIY